MVRGAESAGECGHPAGGGGGEHQVVHQVSCHQAVIQAVTAVQDHLQGEPRDRGPGVRLLGHGPADRGGEEDLRHGGGLHRPHGDLSYLIIN